MRLIVFCISSLLSTINAEFSYGDIDFWSPAEYFFPTVVESVCELGTFEEHLKVCAEKGGRLLVPPSQNDLILGDCTDQPSFVGLYTRSGDKKDARFLNGGYFTYYSSGTLNNMKLHKCFALFNGTSVNYINTDCNSRAAAFCQLPGTIKREEDMNVFGAVFSGPFQGGVKIIVDPNYQVFVRGAIGHTGNFAGKFTMILIKDQGDDVACSSDRSVRPPLMTMYKYFFRVVGEFEINSASNNGFGKRINIEGGLGTFSDWNMESYTLVVTTTGQQPQPLDCARVYELPRNKWLKQVSIADTKFATGVEVM